MKVGVGLWTLQSTRDAPTNVAASYSALAAQAQEVEQMGFHSMWFAEHRFWYDNWCPQPMIAMAAAARVTQGLHLGTAMMLLSQHDSGRFARTCETLEAVAPGRIQLGVGLGHRDAEFDGLGLRRDQRGRMMEEALDRLDPLGIPTWIGGMADAALRRGASRGHGFVLPQTLYPDEIQAHVAQISAMSAEAGRARGPIGIIKDCWVTGDASSMDSQIAERIRRHYREEAGSWWILRGSGNGFQQPELLERQLERVFDAALIGPANMVAEHLRELEACGIDLVILRFWFDVTAGADALRSMASLADAALDGSGSLR